MKASVKKIGWYAALVLGCAIFSFGFSYFLTPNNLNTGGITGLAMILRQVLGFGSVGFYSAAINLPLFIIAGVKIGKKFFWGSLLGMLASSAFIDLFAAVMPVMEMEPLLATIYGGLLCGAGLGLVFMLGASTGGSDIVVRLLKQRMQHLPIGTISMAFDGLVVVLTGLAFRDISRALYSGVVIFITGRVIDAMVYRFDYSKVVLIISPQFDAIAKAIGLKLDRGATFLDGQGSYSGKNTKIVLTVVKRQQIAELKSLVVSIDPDAFIVVQEAHQVLGEGFARYSKNSL